MPRSSYMTLTTLFVLLFMAGAGGIATAARQGQVFVKEDAPPMSMAKDTGPQLTNESFIKLLNLEVFEIALKGDVSWCKNDKKCINGVTVIKNMSCIVDTCAEGGSKDPSSCLNFSGDKDQLNTLVCNLLRSPGPETKQAFLQVYPKQMDDTMSGAAFYSALKGNSDDCQDQIKKYKGPYGSKWNFSWYGALSGCRILAGQRTREEEEKDLSVWFFDVKGDVQHCLRIEHLELRDACRASKGIPPDF